MPGFLLKQTTRREMLWAATFFAGAGTIAGWIPGTASGRAEERFAGAPAQQSDPVPADPVERMKQQLASTPLQTLKLRDHLHMLYGPGGNIVVLDGPDGKIMVDASVAIVAPKILEVMDGFGGAPLKMLINTHWHFDHTDGNAAMHQSGATILAHENTRKRLSTPQFMKLFGMHFPASPAEALPQQTFPANFTLYFNREEITLGHFQPAHTDTDIYVHYGNADVLHMGDTWFNGMYPVIDESTGGRINGMIAAANKGISLASPSTKIVPGHGPVGDLAELIKYRDMLVTIRNRIRTQKASGKKLAQVIADRPTADFDAVWGGGLIKPDMFVSLVYSTL
jgi:cyclase